MVAHPKKKNSPKKAGRHTFFGTGKQFGKHTSSVAKRKKK